MGLKRRQRARSQPRAVIDTHNQHDPRASWHQIDERRKKEQDKRWRQDASEAPRRG